MSSTRRSQMTTPSRSPSSDTFEIPSWLLETAPRLTRRRLRAVRRILRKLWEEWYFLDQDSKWQLASQAVHEMSPGSIDATRTIGKILTSEHAHADTESETGRSRGRSSTRRAVQLRQLGTPSPSPDRGSPDIPATPVNAPAPASDTNAIQLPTPDSTPVPAEQHNELLAEFSHLKSSFQDLQTETEQLRTTHEKLTEDLQRSRTRERTFKINLEHFEQVLYRMQGEE